LLGVSFIAVGAWKVNENSGKADHIQIGKYCFDPASECLELNGDKMALRRVVMNLLDNAVKFTPPQGLIQVSCLLVDNRLTITIKDNGPGIAAEEIPSLFKRFAQAKLGRTHQAGTGLGLYLCNQIVEAHGGRIVCNSQLGVGTTLVVTLPVRRNVGIIQ